MYNLCLYDTNGNIDATFWLERPSTLSKLTKIYYVGNYYGRFTSEQCRFVTFKYFLCTLLQMMDANVHVCTFVLL